jgi:hypothetical protein
MARQCVIATKKTVHAAGTISVLPPKRVAAVVSLFTSEQEVIDQLTDLCNAKGVPLPTPPLDIIQLIDLLTAAKVTPGEINLKLTNYLEQQNRVNAALVLGCCQYDEGGGVTACCNLTQEQCDAIGGEFFAGGVCL